MRDKILNCTKKDVMLSTNDNTSFSIYPNVGTYKRNYNISYWEIVKTANVCQLSDIRYGNEPTNANQTWEWLGDNNTSKVLYKSWQKHVSLLSPFDMKFWI